MTLGDEAPQVVAPDEFGVAEFVFHPTAEQLESDVEVLMVFVNEVGAGPSVSIPLSSFFGG